MLVNCLAGNAATRHRCHLLHPLFRLPPAPASVCSLRSLCRCCCCCGSASALCHRMLLIVSHYSSNVASGQTSLSALASSLQLTIFKLSSTILALLCPSLSPPHVPAATPCHKPRASAALISFNGV